VRVPLSWLRDYVDIALSPRELADALTMRGMEVSVIETAGADWTDVVVGRLLEVRRHPNADTLWFTRVDVGPAGGELEIVCGAQNIEAGQLVPTALVGAVLPGDRRIERTKIRGVASHGMLCSPIELGLGTDADGILVLGAGDDHPVGAPLAEVVGETVLDVDVKPNRGDALSMVGLAREIAAFTGAELRVPEATWRDGAEAVERHVSVRIDDQELCPRFTALWFDNVRNGPSPEWMQRRLVAAGMRPISAVVDITNYVTHELGQPQHAYDADAIPNGEIVVRRARSGERLETIDHVDRVLDEQMLVIADREQPIGLAGIMGGASTEVSEATERVILESAAFDGPTIRNTARRLGLRSEASMRHEKELGPDLPRLAAHRAAQLLQEITGATPAAGIVDSDPGPHAQHRLAVRPAYLRRLLGIPLEAARVRELLVPLGFAVAGEDDEIEVVAPPHRPDVVVPADVAEEVARAHGYDRIPGRLPTAELPSYRPDPSASRHAVRRILAGFGLDEAVTHALIGPEDLRRVRLDPEAPDLVRLYNPLSVEHSLLRPSMTPSLLGALAENARQRRPAAWLFDLGKVYWYRADAPTPRDRAAETAGTGRYESWELGIILAGPATSGAPGDPDRPADVATLKGIVDALHDALGAPRPAYRPESGEERHAHRHPGRAGRMHDARGRAYGSLGEVHPAVADAWGVPEGAVDASIDLGRLLDLVPSRRTVRGIPAAQPIDRDLAVIVDEATPVGDLLRVARTSAGPMLDSLHLFDVYRGEQIGSGRVSYALAFRFQPEAAGDEQAVERAMNKVRGSLRHHLSAEIR
jgi:phenylalanyl-tRNA synthetase beta chain